MTQQAPNLNSRLYPSPTARALKHARRLLVATSASCALLGGMAGAQETDAAPAAAQDDGRQVLKKVTVTATKQETDLQETPIAITAVAGEDLYERDLRDIQSLSVAVPGLVFAEAVSQQQVTLRGIGLDIPNMSGEPGVAFHIDGIYQGSLNQATAAFGELERIEVLRGPQGTLYGRNATGGAINLITKEPSFDPEAEVSLLLGNYERTEVRAAASGGLTESIAGRISLYHEDREGYRVNRVNGERVDDSNRFAVRGSLLFNLSENLDFVLRADYSEDNYTGVPNKPLGVGDPSAGESEVQIIPGIGRYESDPLVIYADYPNDFERQIWGVSGTATYDAGAFEFKSITAYREDEMPLFTDSDGTELFGTHINNFVGQSQFSQEFQLLSTTDGPLQWIAGLYYYTQEGDLGVNALIAVPGLPGGFAFVVDTTQDTQSTAAFGEVYYNFDDTLKLTVGGRYTVDEKEFANTFGVSGSDDWTSFTPKIGLEKNFSDNIFGYVTISKGFKAGGFNIFDATGRSFDPEEVLAYEAGLKSDLLNNQLRVNTSVFYYDYTDLQVTQFPGDGTQFISNAADARIYGLEVDFLAALTDWLRVDGAASYLNAKFESFETADLLDPTGPLVSLEGKSLIRSPEYSGTFGTEIDLPVFEAAGNLTFRGEVVYSDDYFFTVFNRDPARQKSYTLTNAFLNFDSAEGDWRVSVFGRNLGDEAILSSAFETPRVGTYQAPRTYGVSVTKKF